MSQRLMPRARYLTSCNFKKALKEDLVGSGSPSVQNAKTAQEAYGQLCNLVVY